MSRLILIGVGIVISFLSQAQEPFTLSRQEAETIFLQNNLLLISEKLNIKRQEAAVIQARVWPNPEFSISEVNLWATDRQTGGQEVSPPFWNDFGRNQQVSFEINQLIQTAGKRKKLIALEQLDVSKAAQYFEDLLRALQLELRNQLTELQYIQQARAVHEQLVANISLLTNAYKNQLENGNISKSEYIRLKAQELEINQEILELNRQSMQIQKELKLLLQLDPAITLQISDVDFIIDPEPYRAVSIELLIEDARQNRPDFKLALLQEEYSDHLLAYEKSQRVPDLTFGAHYDRNGGTMLDFVGFGVSFELPFFNRNRGNIQKAHIGIEHARIQRQQIAQTIENEIRLALWSLQESIDFLKNIEPDYESELDLLLENHTTNFADRNISMLEYFDFMDAYLNNKNIILNARKEINQKAEVLHHALGKDL